MRRLVPVLLGALLLASCSSSPQPAEKASAPAAAPVAEAKPLPPGVPPETILFEAKNGNVNFTHAQHIARVDGKCETCHPKIFPQSREPINYKKANHRVSEATYTSCASCHAVGATSFAADSNCQKCHINKYK
jgi:c(7)-type cytochrome triheme protein